MTRLFLAAGVAALAISAPAGAQRDNDRQRDRSAKEERAERPQKAQAQRAERPQRAQRVERQAQRAERPQRVERQAQRAERPQRVERQAQRAERPQRVERQAQRAERPQRVERQAERRVERQQVERRVERQADSQRIQRGDDRVQRQAVADRTEQRVDRRADRMTDRVDSRLAERQRIRADRIDRIGVNAGARIDNRIERARLGNGGYARRVAAFRDASTTWAAPRARGRAFIDGCPPGLWMKNSDCLPPGQAAKLLGAPLSTVSSFMTLNALPRSLNYLYPDNDDYYYRYGDGYLYQVDRSDNLIMSLLPLIAGGFVPGQYLPASYMNSYVPNYYGLNSFYQDSQYDCNRYHDGVVYQVDCVTGMIEGVVPLYASGYGVGQMLPSAYSYYNVPSQYRSLYYDNDDYGYYYAPGAIYQYDQGSSLITSVAALLSPGFSIGQQMPMGYNTYNVPYGYRTNYYDTQNDWYRYNNGNIYRVDPTTQLVTAIVASILT